MPPITWRNVNAPNFGAELSALEKAGAGLGESITGLGGVVADFATTKEQRDTDAFIAELNAAPDDVTRTQMVAAANKSFLDLGQVTEAQTAAQDQDIRVAKAGRDVTAFERAGEAHTAELAAAAQDLKFGKTAEAQEALIRPGAVTAQTADIAATTAGTAGKVLSNTALAQAEKDRGVIRDNDAKATSWLATMNDPEASQADRLNAVQEAQTFARTNKLSAAVAGQVKASTTFAMESAVADPAAVTAAAGSVFEGIKNWDTDPQAIVKDAPTDSRKQIVAELAAGFEKTNPGLHKAQYQQMAKASISKDPALSKLLTNIDQRVAHGVALDKVVADKSLQATATERNMLADLRTGSIDQVQTMLMNKHEQTEEGTMDGGKLSRIISKTLSRAEALLKNSGLTGDAVNLAVIKLLKDSRVDWDFPSRNNLVHHATDPSTDISEVADHEFLAAINSKLLPGERLTDTRMNSAVARGAAAGLNPAP